ncbi:hypothetical protein [Komagataeibacter sp. FNDCR2]|uniref:hypothetical protein n=1 Tax=Komagataeibacter sp. FNDCR2 TaxID=2878682 RepID=UPI001E47FA28|nr:hypothetical protein [Komagataeibacter sp. FNDCR2]MCE2575208.1 hypothetical protein [Komagataeibacter sp. FNDCR2]
MLQQVKHKQGAYRTAHVRQKPLTDCRTTQGTRSIYDIRKYHAEHIRLHGQTRFCHDSDTSIAMTVNTVHQENGIPDRHFPFIPLPNRHFNPEHKRFL